MAKQNILIVDTDPESVKVLEVSLKKAGYSVTKSSDGQDALEMVGFAAPDLIISDTKMPNLDGFGLCTKLKENEETAHIPFIFLTSEKSIEDKIRGLELGVEDYLNKPIFIREILVRVNLALQRREKERLENRTTSAKSKFSGSLQDMGVVDLLQTIDLGHKSGVIHLKKADDTGNIFFRDGQVIDATTDTRTGADAVYRMLVWSEGEFEIEFMTVDQEQRIELSTQGLLMEGMRQLDEWGRLQEQLPPLTAVFDVDEVVLAERLGEIPDEVNVILRHFDGRSPLMEVVDRAGLGDLEALTVISKLYFEGLILEVPPKPTIPAPAETEAILSDESLVSKQPQQVQVPSRVVDDAIGPHLSVAADPLGFVRALTQSAPPVAPPTEEEATKPGTEIVDIAAPESEPPEDQQPVTVQKRLPRKIEFVKDEKSIAGEARTMLGLGAPSADPSPVEKKEKKTTTKPPPGPSGAVVRKTKPLAAKDMSADNEIAAAIDAEFPPPSSLTNEDSISEEISGYFEGEAYKASFNARPSYEPSPPEAQDEETEASKNASGEDSDELSSVPSNVLNLDDDDEDWGEEHEDEPSIPTNVKAIIPVVAILLLVIIGGLILFLREDEPATPTKTSESKDADEKLETPKALVPSGPLSIKSVKSGKPSEQKTTPENGDDAKQAAVAAPAVDTAKAETTKPASPSDTAEQEQEATGTTEPSATGTTEKKALTPEEKAKLKKLLAEVERSGKRRKITLLEEAIELNPTSDTAIALLSIQLLEAKQTRDRALELAEKAISINPDNAMGWLAKGYIHQLNSEADKAKECYRKCADCSGPQQYTRECRRLAR